ncbi:MAG: hypothetical protein ACT4O5_07025 [Gammaproteobacteria bacterium]
MDSERLLPVEFGGTWATFCAQWCPEGTLGYTADEVVTGLQTIKRLYPEDIDRTLSSGVSGGTWAPAVCVETGLLLATCEHLRFFGPVLAHLRSGQRSAYSELVVAAALQRLGYEPEFEAGPGEPDLRCDVGDAEMAVEVYAPDAAYASQEQKELVRLLHAALSEDLSSNCRVELSIHETFTKLDIPSALETVRSAPASSWTSVGTWGRVRRVDEGQNLPSTFDGDGAQIKVAGDTDVKGTGRSLVIRWEESDTRAERALQAKRAQLQSGVRNLVVMNVCATGGVGEWPEHISRLTGTDYEKIGAVAFFDQGAVGPPEAIRRRWRVVENPRAHIALPEAVLGGLEELDESSYLGIRPKPRLRMC